MNGIANVTENLYTALEGTPHQPKDNAAQRQANVILFWLGFWGFSPAWIMQLLLDVASPGTVSKALALLKSGPKPLVQRHGLSDGLPHIKRRPSWTCWALTNEGFESLQARSPFAAPQGRFQPPFPFDWKDSFATQYMTIHCAHLLPLEELDWEHHRNRDRRPDDAWYSKVPDMTLVAATGERISLEADPSRKSETQRLEQIRRVIADLVDGRYQATIFGVVPGQECHYEDSLDDALRLEAETHGQSLHHLIDSRVRILPLQCMKKFRVAS